METINLLKSGWSLIAVVLAIGMLGIVVGLFARQWVRQNRIAVTQLFPLLGFVLLFGYLGGLLISPTGPGSGFPVYTAMTLPILYFLAYGPPLRRLVAAALLLIVISGALFEYRLKVRVYEANQPGQALTCPP